MIFSRELDPRLVARCRELAQRMAVEDHVEQLLPERKGSLTRTRFRVGDQTVLRLEIREAFVNRLVVDLTPLGAVLVVLDVSKKGLTPGRILALHGDRAGEFVNGALEAAWGTLLASREPIRGLSMPGEPRRLRLDDVLKLAEMAF